MYEYELLSDERVLAASDDQLAYTIAVLVEEQKKRALQSGDLQAVADDAFSTWGFDRKGQPSQPRLIGGLLVCPGYKYEKSSASHDCAFVSAEGTWIWEHPDLAFDEMRSAPGSKKIRLTVSILPAWEGLEFDIVKSSARSGPCRMKEAHSYRVEGGKLVATQRKVRERSETR